MSLSFVNIIIRVSMKINVSVHYLDSIQFLIILETYIITEIKCIEKYETMNDLAKKVLQNYQELFILQYLMKFPI